MIAAVIVALLAAEPSPSDLAYGHYQQGVALFKAGKYRKAAAELQLAYNLDPAPELLYNLGRAHEEAGDRDAAITHFRTYLARYPDAADRPDVERRIEVLTRVADAAAPSRLGVTVEVAVALAADAHFEDLERKGAAGQFVAGGEDTLHGNYGVAGGYELPVLDRLRIGGRAGLFFAAGDDREGDLLTVDLGALGRYVHPIGRLDLFAALALGPSFVRWTQRTAQLGGGGGTFTFAGFGWHAALGLGVAYPVAESFDLTSGLYYLHQGAPTLSGEAKSGGETMRLELPDTAFDRYLFAVGARF